MSRITVTPVFSGIVEMDGLDKNWEKKLLSALIASMISRDSPWLTAVGVIVKIADMETPHLLNTIKWLRRQEPSPLRDAYIVAMTEEYNNRVLPSVNQAPADSATAPGKPAFSGWPSQPPEAGSHTPMNQE